MTSFILSLLFSFTPPEGTWVYLGQHQITAVREYQISSQDLTRLGYQCLRYQQTQFQCSKALTNQSSPELTSLLLNLENTKLKIYFPADKPELILNTEYLQQYRVEQKAILQKIGEEDYLYFPVIEYGVYKTHLKIYLTLVDDKFIFEKQNSESDLSIYKNFDIGAPERFTRYSTKLIWQEVK